MGLIASKFTAEYAIWKVRRSRNLVIPPAIEAEFVEETPQEGLSDLEIAKQVFEEEKKKMRMISQKQQEEIEKWREEAEMQEDRLRKMSTNYETSKKNYQRLNEDMIKLERKFKYAGLKTSFGLP